MQQDQIRAIKRAIRAKKELEGAANDREERIKQKKAEIEARPNPFLRELDFCDDLIAYCNKLKVLKGLAEPSTEEEAKDVEKKLISASTQFELD